ncbi:MAG: hypothetical protein CME71_05775 [Halobacteriovorax sp.]|nr:hypothetical protein [Halobacteriovorax sp.]|tara:strand:+ start:296 stop:1795 length:1500 start_codon:yes stop_codon:yes gene_type:complete
MKKSVVLISLILQFGAFAPAIAQTTDFTVFQNATQKRQDFIAAITHHQKLQTFLFSYGEFLIHEIQAKRSLTGEHLNSIQEGLSAYLDESMSLYNLSLERANWGQKLAIDIHLAESLKAVYDIYYGQSLLRKIVKDQQQFEDYGLGSMSVLKDILLSKDFAKSIAARLENRTFESESFFDQLIVDSRSHSIVKANGKLEDYLRIGDSFSDRVSSVVGSITSALSQGFGALVGNIEWRTGYLYQNEIFTQQIKSQLKPLDLLFEKKSFKLTDKTIPGNWGHTAVWLGEEAQLRALGIWDAPELDFFREKIRNGESIFEMRRWGMQFDSIENFLNLDEISITRVSDILNRTKSDLLKVYRLLSEQANKGYDFSFDAMATAKVTCTEIVMLSYGQVNWPMDRVLGRFSITPNNMAEIALFDHSPVEFVAYYRAKKLHEVQSLDINEFARVLEYRKRAGESLGFEKVLRICKNERYRHHGAMRMRLRCHDEFQTNSYDEPREY